MAIDEKRSAPRRAVSLRVKLRYAGVDQFIAKFATNLSRTGMFLATRSPQPIGTELRFELRLADGAAAIAGRGVVRWVLEQDRSQPDQPHGMGIEFLELDEASRILLEVALAVRGARGDLDLDTLPGPRPAPDGDDGDGDDDGARQADAMRRARALAGELAAASDDDREAALAALLDHEAVPRPTVDEASRELAARLGGAKVSGRRGRGTPDEG